VHDLGFLASAGEWPSEAPMLDHHLKEGKGGGCPRELKHWYRTESTNVIVDLCSYGMTASRLRILVAQFQVLRRLGMMLWIRYLCRSIFILASQVERLF